MTPAPDMVQQARAWMDESTARADGVEPALLRLASLLTEARASGLEEAARICDDWRATGTATNTGDIWRQTMANDLAIIFRRRAAEERADG